MNKEKVIKELHDARRYLEDKEWSDRGASPHIDAINDALAMLKEQEAIEPDVDSEGTCSCGNCGTTVGYYQAGCSVTLKLYKYCPECGNEVKWDV